ncbi:MAG: flagellar basal body P-ring formation chaperone FlgA [Pyrinomonadaceae bacterium]
MRQILIKFAAFVSPFGCLAAMLIVLASGLAAGAQPLISIRVAPESAIESDQVNLGMIAQISGGSERTERLKNISLGYAPNIGVTREIGRDQIVLSIRAAGYHDGEFTLFSLPKTLVRRIGQSVSSDTVREVVERVVLGQFTIDGVMARITRLDVPDPIQVQTGKIEIKASMPGIRNLFEPFLIPVEIRVDNQIVKNFAATIEIEAFADVLVAARDLIPNDKLGGTDVRIEKHRLERPISSYLRDTERLRGKQIIKSIASGTPITSDSFVASLVVKLGDPIRIEGRVGNVQIVIAGEARSSGRIGDRIAVRNTQSGAILQAVIVDEGLVKVTF